MRGEQARGQKIVGESVRGARDEIGCRRRDDDDARFAREAVYDRARGRGRRFRSDGAAGDASKVIAPTNSRAPRVITTSTSAPPV